MECADGKPADLLPKSVEPKSSEDETQEGDKSEIELAKSWEFVDKPGERRGISISVCSSAQERNVAGLLTFLKELQAAEKPHLTIKKVEFYPLPYNDLDRFRFSLRHPVDVMILCHSIFNRRFAISDLDDALYDKFLLDSEKAIRRGKIAVLAHDFQDMADDVDDRRMGEFRRRQPTVFRASKLVLTCGQLEEEPVLAQRKREELIRFLEEASAFPEDMNIVQGMSTYLFEHFTRQSTESSVRGNGSEGSLGAVGSFLQRGISKLYAMAKTDIEEGSPVDGNRSHEAVLRGTKQTNPFDGPKRKMADDAGMHKRVRDERGGAIHGGRLESARNVTKNFRVLSMADFSESSDNMATAQGDATRTSESVNMNTRSQKTIITVCSVSAEESVDGLIHYIRLNDPEEKRKVRFVHLDDLDQRISKKGPRDVDFLLLCHSAKDWGVLPSIIKTVESLHKSCLRGDHCSVGKPGKALIVHDFEEILERNAEYMETLAQQKSTLFSMFSLVIACGKLSSGVQMVPEDFKKLDAFLSEANASTTSCGQKRGGSGVIPSSNILPSNTPTRNIPSSSIPSTNIPSTNIPSSSIPSTNIPSTNIPSSNTPSSNIPSTNIPSSNIPSSNSPSTNISSSNIPSTNIPSSNIPSSNISSGNIPSSNTPSSNITSSNIPSSNIPFSNIPSTNIPSSIIPSSNIPSSNIPSNYVASHVAPRPLLPAPHSTHQESESATIRSYPIARATAQRQQPISVVICTSARDYNVAGLRQKLTEQLKEQPDLIGNVRQQELPYNDLDRFKLPQVYSSDVIVLCHSVQNRGFAITDVRNSLYDKFLRRCYDIFGRHRLAVIVHDFKDNSREAQNARVVTFQQQQPSTFRLAGLVLTCGSLADAASIQQDDWGCVCVFLQQASCTPPTTRLGS